MRCAIYISLGGLLLGCVKERAVELPSLDGIQTLILSYYTDEEESVPRYFASPTSSLTAAPLTFDDEQIGILGFSRSLEELMLTEGPLDPPTPVDCEAEIERGLPSPSRSWIFEDSARFEVVDQLPAAALREDLPNFALESCIAKGGCLTRDGNAPLCGPPCSDTPEILVEAPMDPRELPCVDCSHGSTAQRSCEGGWPSGAPTDAVFVRPDATGDGSQGAPLGSIEEALADSNPTIVLAEGSYAETVTIGKGVTIIGCERSVLSASEGWAIVIEAQESEVVHLEGFGVSGGIDVRSGTANLREISGVSNGAPVDAGIHILDRAVIDQARLRGFTSGIWVEGGVVRVTRSTIEESADIGVLCEKGRVDVEASHIVESANVGLSLQTCSGTVASTLVEDSGSIGVEWSSKPGRPPSAPSRFEDSIIRSSSQQSGWALQVRNATVTIERVRLNVQNGGLNIEGGHTTVRDIEVEEGGATQQGLVNASMEAVLELERAKLRHTHIRAPCIRISNGASAKIRDVFCEDGGSALDVADATVDVSRLHSRNFDAFGVQINGESSFLLNHITVEQSRSCMRFAALTPEVNDPKNSLSNIALSNCTSFGVMLTQGVIDLDSVLIEDSGTAVGPDPFTNLDPFGGMEMLSFTMNRFVLSRNAVGLDQTSPIISSETLSNGRILDNATGVLVKPCSFDLLRLMNQVHFEQNDNNIEYVVED